MSSNNTVLIIGGGAAGLSTAAALAKHNIKATIIERDDKIGASWSRRYHNLKLHTVRKFSGLAHYPIPKNLPRYLSKDEYALYLNEYAKVHGLDISLAEKVLAISRADDESASHTTWIVETNKGTREAKAVVIATGKYAQAYFPKLEGMANFPGLVLHSSQYTTNEPYRGKKVLVIGLGNSGAEIAAELADNDTTHVAVSVRTPPPIVTRELFKFIPVQVLGIVLSKLKVPRIIDYIGAQLRRISIGNLSKFGLAEAEWGPFTSQKPAVIDSGFVKQLKRGRIKIRPEITRFESSNVVYTDGTKEHIDVVIAATGFRSGLESILKESDVIDEAGQPLSQQQLNTSAPGLFFVGFNDTVRGQLFEINRESKQLAHDISLYLRSPGT